MKNEQYFEIQLAELDADYEESAFASDTASDWTTTADKYTVTSYTGTSFFATSATSPYYNSGVTDGTNALGSSLFSGSKHAEFALELGKRYMARIRAVNDVGSSDWVALTLPTATADSGRTINSKAVTYKEFTSATINLYRITYDPNGYTFYPQGKDDAGYTSKVFKYVCRNTSGANLIDISNGSSTIASGTYVPSNTNSVVLDPSSPAIFNKWLDISTGSEFSDATLAASTDNDVATTATKKYTGFTNLYLKAYSGGNTGYVITQPENYAIQTGWVTLTDSASTTYTVANDGGITANGSSYIAECKQGKLTVELNMATDTDTWVYDSVEFKITRSDSYQYLYEKKTSIKRGSPVSVESYLGVGYYQVMITGKYGNAVNSFTIDLTVTSN